MKSLIRDVMLANAAATVLLAMTAVAPVSAQQQPAAVEPIASVAVAAPGRALATDAASAASDPRPAAVAEPSPGGIERRCRRIDRIGKATITRCDRR